MDHCCDRDDDVRNRLGAGGVGHAIAEPILAEESGVGRIAQRAVDDRDAAVPGRCGLGDGERPMAGIVGQNVDSRFALRRGDRGIRCCDQRRQRLCVWFDRRSEMVGANILGGHGPVQEGDVVEEPGKAVAPGAAEEDVVLGAANLHGAVEPLDRADRLSVQIERRLASRAGEGQRGALPLGRGERRVADPDPLRAQIRRDIRRDPVRRGAQSEAVGKRDEPPGAVRCVLLEIEEERVGVVADQVRAAGDLDMVRPAGQAQGRPPPVLDQRCAGAGQQRVGRLRLIGQPRVEIDGDQRAKIGYR